MLPEGKRADVGVGEESEYVATPRIGTGSGEQGPSEQDQAAGQGGGPQGLSKAICRVQLPS